jgi:hypothetical protein
MRRRFVRQVSRLAKEHFMTSRLTLFALACIPALLPTAAARADDDHAPARYEVKVTNLTRGQQFTPILVAIHNASVSLLELGTPARAELAILAEEGATAPLAAALAAQPGVAAVGSGSGLTDPGATTTLVIEGRGGFGRLSAAAMLIPTNDGFFAVNGVQLPRGGETLVYLALAYDSGSERNDESCASIPGPNFKECNGSGGGGAPAGGEEGFVHIHAGMHGIGDFKPSDRDWRNPVARITVRRVH